MKISPVIKYNVLRYENNKPQNNQENQINNKYTAGSQNSLINNFNDYMLFFGARVDKGLNRFYDENKDRMPITVRNFVEPLKYREIYTPLEAQQKAFAKLEDAKSVEDIKNAYPEEPLFDSLRDTDSVKSTRGILNSLRQNKELLDLYGIGALRDNEDLTVYLVKKIFLESKTIDEINQDLENDLQEDFKVDFKSSNPDSDYIHPSTLKALGIKSPDREYQQSLRYTRDGYSDFMGQKISKGLNDFWNNLSVEERTSRAKKSVLTFENWWNKLTLDEKLEMIADTDPETAMLKAYKKVKRAEKREQKALGVEPEQEAEPVEKSKRVKVKSKLGDDKLFIMWATHNLRNYEQSLSEADKDTLHLKKMVRLVQRWQKMSSVERTEYISKMKSGAEPVRYAMIDAWNNSFDIIKDLSAHLKKYQHYKPVNILYSTDEFSQFQSRVMSEFWETHPDYAEKLGNNIRQSQLKVDLAIKRGTFEELKNQINRDKNYRIKQLDRLKAEEAAKLAELEKASQVVEEQDYKTEFREAYNSHVYGKIKSIPKNFYSDMYEKVLNELPEDVVRLWTKNLRGEPISEEDIARLKLIMSEELPGVARVNRAIEAAMAEILYATTNDASVYEMSNSDVKMAMYHLERGESPIKIISHKNNNKIYTLFIRNKYKSNYSNRINELYENFKKDLSYEKVEEIIDYNFLLHGNDGSVSNQEYVQLRNELAEYIKSYGRSALILFSDKTAYSLDVKKAFARKFIANMPESLRTNPLLSEALDNGIYVDFKNNLAHAKVLFSHRFPFLPPEFVNSYIDEVGLALRSNVDNGFTMNDFMHKVCVRRKDAASGSKVFGMPKARISKFERKLEMLAMEQALADAFYETIGDENAYKLSLEMLCDKLELVSLVKKFPCGESYAIGVDSEQFKFAPKKKPNLAQIRRHYNEYLSEIKDWVNENNITQDSDFEELIYILNPEEGNMNRDINVNKRIASYGLKVDHFTINPPKP